MDQLVSPLIVTPENLAAVSAPFPYGVRQAIGFGAKLDYGKLDVSFPDGQRFRFEGAHPGPQASMQIHDFGFAARLAREGEIGIAEAYMCGEWDTPDLTQFLLLFCSNQAVVQNLLDGKPLVRLGQRLFHWFNRNTKSGSKRNIYAHYDLGNTFYGEWLDESMTYSSAIYSYDKQPLYEAQQAKYAALAHDTDIQAGQHVLEIGCGWGGFAQFAAQERGCKVTALTISKAQHEFASKRIFEAGLNEKVSVKLQDYRDEKGQYDRIASIEMFEAVGSDYWPVYFAQLRDRLKPGGKVGLQIITIQDRMWKSYTREMDFIRRYIFPGGMLPTPSILAKLAQNHDFKQENLRIFGLDYARTLTAWRQKFRAGWKELTPLGFDERFRRMWEYYFAYCEAGFLSGQIDVRQIVYAK